MTGTLHADTIEKANGDPVDLTGQYASKALCNYDQSTPEIEGSHNVSSVTDNSTGDYTINFTNAFGSTADRYVTSLMWNTGDDSSTQGATDARAGLNTNIDYQSLAVGSLRMNTWFQSHGSSNGGAFDGSATSTKVVGDLA